MSSPGILIVWASSSGIVARFTRSPCSRTRRRGFSSGCSQSSSGRKTLTNLSGPTSQLSSVYRHSRFRALIWPHLASFVLPRCSSDAVVECVPSRMRIPLAQDTTNIYLVTSRDGRSIDDEWVYAHQPLLTKGARQKDWDAGFVLPASGLVHTAKEHLLYYEARLNGLHHEQRFDGPAVLGVAQWDRDRLGGLRCADGDGGDPEAYGEFTTKLFALCRECVGVLAVDFDLDRGERGALRVEVLSADDSHVFATAHPITRAPRRRRREKLSTSAAFGLNSNATLGPDPNSETDNIADTEVDDASREPTAAGHPSTAAPSTSPIERSSYAASTTHAASPTTTQARAGRTRQWSRRTVVRWQATASAEARSKPVQLLPRATSGFGLQAGQLVKLRFRLYGKAKLYSFQFVK